MMHRVVSTVKLGRGAFVLTKIVYLRHALHICNMTEYSIVLSQPDTTLPRLTLGVGAVKPFSWSAAPAVTTGKGSTKLTAQMRLLKLAMKQPGVPDDRLQWTSAFKVDEVGDFWLRVNSSSGEEGYAILHISIVYDRSTARHIAYVTEDQQPPFRLENYLPVEVGYLQHQESATDTAREWNHLAHQMSVDYTWEVPLGEKRLDIYYHGKTHTFDITQVGQLDDLADGKTTPAIIHAEVVIEQYTRVLKLYQQGQDSGDADGGAAAVVDPHDIPDNNVTEVRIHSIGLSLVDNSRHAPVPVELLYLLIDGIHVHLGSCSTKALTEVVIADIQVANQMPDTEAPILFGRSHSHLDTGGQDTDKGAAENIGALRDHIHFSMVVDLVKSPKNVAFYE